jgi:transposase InsO family protein
MPQTNGKLERFHGEIQRKQKWFSDIDELIHWWNYTKPHMSLDWDNLETLAKYERCQNQEQQLLTSNQERYMMSKNER